MEGAFFWIVIFLLAAGNAQNLTQTEIMNLIIQGIEKIYIPSTQPCSDLPGLPIAPQPLNETFCNRYSSIQCSGGQIVLMYE